MEPKCLKDKYKATPLGFIKGFHHVNFNGHKIMLLFWEFG